MGADLALVDQAFLGFVHELDRVFHCQDMAVFGFVQEVDHGGQCGGFARPSGAGDEHHATRFERQVAKNFGGVELLQGQYLGRNGPEHATTASVVVKRVDPKAGQAFNFKREVNLQKLFKVFALTVVHDVIHHGVHCLMVQRLNVDAPNITVNPDHGRKTR